jgi:hypothetical protein
MKFSFGGQFRGLTDHAILGWIKCMQTEHLTTNSSMNGHDQLKFSGLMMGIQDATH